MKSGFGDLNNRFIVVFVKKKIKNKILILDDRKILCGIFLIFILNMLFN